MSGGDVDSVISTFDGDYDHHGGNSEYEAFHLYMMMSDYVHCRDDGGEEYETFGPLHEVQNHLFPFLLLVLRGHVVFPLRLCTVSNNMATLSEQAEASSCPCVKWKYL